MNPAILALQEALWNLGVSPGPRDGRWGPATRSACRRVSTFAHIAESPVESPPQPERYSTEELLTAARTVYGEARGEPYEGMKAVAHVISNRSRVYRPDQGRSLSEVCRRAWQFSCWNEGDPNRARIEKVTLADPQLGECLSAVVQALHGADPTGGATHYYARSIDPPRWAEGHEPCYRCGGHLFFRGIA